METTKKAHALQLIVVTMLNRYILYAMIVRTGDLPGSSVLKPAEPACFNTFD